jgi:hypothetical protein
VAKSAGGLVAGISGKVGEAVKGGLSSILRKFRTEEQPGTA